MSLVRRLNSQGLIRVGSAMAMTQGLVILVGVGTSVLLARGLGSDGYGTYLFVLNVAQMLAMPILAGMPILVTRQVATYRARRDIGHLTGIIRWAFCAVAVSTVLVTTVGLVVFQISNKLGGGNPTYLIALPIVAGLALIRIASAIIQGFERPFQGSVADSIIRPLTLFVLLGLCTLCVGMSPLLALGLHFAAVVMGAAWAVWYLYFRIEHIPNRRVAAIYKSRDWLLSLVPLSMITAAGLINSRLDILMLGILSEKSEVAIYGLAMQMAGFVLIGQTIFNTIIAPKLARSYAEADKVHLQNMARHSARLGLAVASLMFFTIALLGKPAITFLVGADFSNTFQIALIIGIGHMLNTSAGPVALTMNMMGHERTTARMAWLSAVANGILNVALIPTFGAVGAAISTLVTTAIYQGVLLYRLDRLEGIRTAVFQLVKAREQMPSTLLSDEDEPRPGG